MLPKPSRESGHVAEFVGSLLEENRCVTERTGTKWRHKPTCMGVLLELLLFSSSMVTLPCRGSITTVQLLKWWAPWLYSVPNFPGATPCIDCTHDHQYRQCRQCRHVKCLHACNETMQACERRVLENLCRKKDHHQCRYRALFACCNNKKLFKWKRLCSYLAKYQCIHYYLSVCIRNILLAWKRMFSWYFTAILEPRL